MADGPSSQISRRAQRRKKHLRPKSAQAYEEWKSKHSQTANAWLSKLKNHLDVPTLEVRVMQLLSGHVEISNEKKMSDGTGCLEERILDHAALVQRQSKLAKAAKKEFWKQKTRSEIEMRIEIGSKSKSNSFPFPKLPPELRDMVYKVVFEETSGMKPTLLWALQDYNKLYPEARKAWCGTNDFRFSLLESKANTRDGLEEKEMELLKKATALVSKDIQACSKLSLVVLRAQNLECLTLEVASKVGFVLTIHNIIPNLKKLKKITLRLSCGKTRKERMKDWTTWMVGHTYPDLFRNTVETRKMLDTMLGKEGKLIESESKPWMQIWVWEVKGKDEVFRPKKTKTHIKFD